MWRATLESHCPRNCVTRLPSACCLVPEAQLFVKAWILILCQLRGRLEGADPVWLEGVS
jgi:hypothetical protein